MIRSRKVAKTRGCSIYFWWLCISAGDSAALSNFKFHLKPDRFKRAMESTPDSLYIFLNLLLGGKYLQEGKELADDKRKIVSALDDKTLDALGESYAIIRQNLVKGIFVNFSTHSADINEMDRKVNLPCNPGGCLAVQIGWWRSSQRSRLFKNRDTPHPGCSAWHHSCP